MNLTKIREMLTNLHVSINEHAGEVFGENLVHVKDFRRVGRVKTTGSAHISVYCSCGRFEEIAMSAMSSYFGRSKGCPTCGQKLFIPTQDASSTGYYCTPNASLWGVQEITDEYAVVFQLRGKLFIRQAPAKTEKESLKNAEVYLNNDKDVTCDVAIVQFDKPHPWFLNYYNGVYSLRNGWIARDSFVIQDEKFEALLDTVNERVPGTTVENIHEHIMEMCEKNVVSKPKTVSKAVVSQKEYEKNCFTFEADDENELFDRGKKHFKRTFVPGMREIESSAGYVTYRSYCPECGNAVLYKDLAENRNQREKVQISCPNCGCSRDYLPSLGSYGSYRTMYTNWSWQPEIESVLIRAYEGEAKLVNTGSATEKLEVSFRELGRAFMAEKNSAYFSYARDWTYATGKSTLSYKKKQTTCLDFSRHAFPRWGVASTDRVIMNTNDELGEIISASHLKYSGLKEAWGLSGNKEMKLEEPGMFSETSYLYTWNNRHFVELLLKTGLTKIVKQIAGFKKTASCVAKPRAKNVCELLGINKPVLKIAREINPTLENLNTIQKLWESDQTMTLDDYKKISELNKESVIIDIKQQFNIPYAKALDYVKSCYDFQCIEQSEAMQLWFDYLTLAKKVGYNLKSRDIKFPASLKKAHDICSFVAAKLQSSFDDNAFKARANENARYNYSLKALKMFVVAPTTPQQVIDEGMTLHHCVTNYVNVIIEGRSIVMLIRNEDEPEEPFYTAEILIRGGKPVVTQVKGNMNSDPDTSTAEGKKVMEFVKKWAAFKHMNVEL